MGLLKLFILVSSTILFHFIDMIYFLFVLFAWFSLFFLTLDKMEKKQYTHTLIMHAGQFSSHLAPHKTFTHA